MSNQENKEEVFSILREYEEEESGMITGRMDCTTLVENLTKKECINWAQKKLNSGIFYNYYLLDSEEEYYCKLSEII